MISTQNLGIVWKSKREFAQPRKLQNLLFCLFTVADLLFCILLSGRRIRELVGKIIPGNEVCLSIKWEAWTPQSLSSSLSQFIYFYENIYLDPKKGTQPLAKILLAFVIPWLSRNDWEPHQRHVTKSHLVMGLVYIFKFW